MQNEAGLTKATAAHSAGGQVGGWVGDWYLWHAPDGLGVRAATASECMQARAKKLGVIEARYASAIIGFLSPWRLIWYGVPGTPCPRYSAELGMVSPELLELLVPGTPVPGTPRN